MEERSESYGKGWGQPQGGRKDANRERPGRDLVVCAFAWAQCSIIFVKTLTTLQPRDGRALPDRRWGGIKSDAKGDVESQEYLFRDIQRSKVGIWSLWKAAGDSTQERKETGVEKFLVGRKRGERSRDLEIHP